ncbi:hypothetical protein AeMF1_010437 [Aphanomyces euteiches]|nr:hypothetical protein AeMF1_010437 [Aphanomyces euteiches]KAH9183058.1 hypothetical protein AeNC1_014963 [Aphanomyces euteiches]
MTSSRHTKATAAISVMTSTDLLLFIMDFMDFQQGVYYAYHPLRRLGCLTVTPEAPNTMDQVDELLAPWHAYHSHQRTMALIRSTDQYKHNLIAAHAAFTGNFPVVTTMLEKTTHKCIEANLIDWAASAGRLDMVEYIYQATNGSMTTTTSAMDMAATNGHLNVLQWLHTHRQGRCTVAAVRGAAANGHLDVLAWFASVGIHSISSWWIEAMTAARSNGHTTIVQWLHQHRVDTMQGNNKCLETRQPDSIRHENISSGAGRHADVTTFRSVRPRRLTYPIEKQSPWREHSQQQASRRST